MGNAVSIKVHFGGVRQPFSESKAVDETPALRVLRLAFLACLGADGTPHLYPVVTLVAAAGLAARLDIAVVVDNFNQPKSPYSY